MSTPEITGVFVQGIYVQSPLLFQYFLYMLRVKVNEINKNQSAHIRSIVNYTNVYPSDLTNCVVTFRLPNDNLNTSSPLS